MKTIIYSLTGKTADVRQLLSDPISLVFFGGASYHLYFMPLLVAGLLLLCCANYLTKLPSQTLVLAIFSLFSLIIYQLLINTGNDFNLDTATAFSELMQSVPSNNIIYQPVRIVFVYLSWVIRCLPYFAIALLVNQILKQNIGRWFYSQATVTVFLLICMFANAFAEQLLPRALSEIIIAYSLLLFGISLSKYLPESNLINSLGACSFGIYLIHPLIKSGIDILLAKVLPQITQSISISSMLTYSLTSFFVSWLTIYLMQRNKLIAQYI